MRRVVLVVALLGLACCATPRPSLADEAQVAEYETAQLACVADAGTRAAADECLCALRAQFHRDCDGGVP